MDDKDFERIKAFQKLLLEAYEKISDKELEVLEELRKHRNKLPLATLTILTAVLPFADKYVNFPSLFLVAYTLLFVSVITGLIGTEWILRTAHKFLKEAGDRIREIKGKLKKDLNFDSALEDFQNADRKIVEWPDKISNTSFYLLIAGLLLLFISVFPFKLVQQKGYVEKAGIHSFSERWGTGEIERPGGKSISRIILGSFWLI
ncbi:hypothetical protein A3D88_02950 [Candidatus Peribacteria bacterium RIFCSPHIGHO2_02_FULL_52_16]|nr:MAG: hypothetical protein A2706_06015 [Candidatus Peribacteria bacterium RIFCSPHIGHO2_01_FULL_51_35]OGJ60638.1 MAG: hypothetical protein A3D88_02950 [Candidatus Peribacteria bacterium RIFCSPHIGHO2_02_FULL_52_16]